MSEITQIREIMRALGMPRRHSANEQRDPIRAARFGVGARKRLAAVNVRGIAPPAPELRDRNEPHVRQGRGDDQGQPLTQVPHDDPGPGGLSPGPAHPVRGTDRPLRYLTRQRQPGMARRDNLRVGRHLRQKTRRNAPLLRPGDWMAGEGRSAGPDAARCEPWSSAEVLTGGGLRSETPA
jgi:hypothetical protein